MITKYEVDKEAFIAEKMTEIELKYPYLDLDSHKLNPFAYMSVIGVLTADKISGYNMGLDSFFSDYRWYLNSYYEYKVRKSLSVEIKLFLTNDGNIPAEDLDIYLNFSDGFDLIELDDYKNQPNEPNPPSLPKTSFEELASIGYRSRIIPEMKLPYISKLNKPSITKLKNLEVHFERDSIKHLIVDPLEILVAIYNQYSDMKSFEIDYTIIAANVPEPVMGKLNIIYET